MIDKKVKKMFGWSMFLTIGFAVGVLCIVFGAINLKNSPIWWAMVVPGIGFGAAGFYVMPILWINYGDLREYKKVCDQVLLDNICRISTMASANGWSKELTLQKVTYCIKNRYLVGYLVMENEFIVKNDKQGYTMADVPELMGQVVQIACINCGAKIELRENKVECPYCHTMNYRKTGK